MNLEELICIGMKSRKSEKNINEIKKAVQDVEDELNKDTDSLQKKETETLETKCSLSQIKNIFESYSSTLE
jgi:Sec-independent protein translocase protein TatA